MGNKISIISGLFTFLFLNCILMVEAQTAAKQYPGLKAVLVVGYQEDNTATAIKSMDKIALKFKSYGVKVVKFYNKNAVWEKIVAEAAGADFFVYSGHGTYLGEDGNAGGLVLTDFISVEKMQKELKFKKHPMVIFQSVCLGAGSSAGDDKDIGIVEAEKRVTDYSSSFIKIGASAYFANNFEGGCEKFIDNFLNGKSLQTSYGISTDTAMFSSKSIFYSETKIKRKIETDKIYKIDSSMTISICSNHQEGMATLTTYTDGKKTVKEVPVVKSYDVAYVGRKGYTVKDLMKK